MASKTNNKKILIAIFGTLAVVTFAAIGGGYWFFKYKAGEMVEEAQAAEREGGRAGANLTEQGCFDRSIAVLKTPEGRGISGSIRNNRSLTGCLRASRPVAEFCEGVPDYRNIMTGVLWEQQVCEELKADPDYCTRMVREVGKYCGSPGRAAKLAPAAGAAPGAGDPAGRK